ncbi:hypothetical protein [Psychrobacillus sp. FSL H8-0487]|uniref:hypothetical protein n=1 Tax=Psychrobacillus sp. FSL H8-0487 TaxID=2921391 RepID=UPI0030F77078
MKTKEQIWKLHRNQSLELDTIQSTQVCNYCGTATDKLVIECCESCNQKLYEQEQMEMVLLEEYKDEQKREQDWLKKMNRHHNPLYNPYLKENYSDAEICRLYATQDDIDEYYRS